MYGHYYYIIYDDFLIGPARNMGLIVMLGCNEKKDTPICSWTKKTFGSIGLIVKENNNEKKPMLYGLKVNCHVICHVTYAMSSYMWRYSVEYVVTILVLPLHQ